MSQSHLGSFVEAWVNILVGVVVAYIANMLVLPAVGITINHHQNIIITLVMTVLSLVRSYCLRRFFNQLRLFNRESKKGI